MSLPQLTADVAEPAGARLMQFRELLREVFPKGVLARHKETLSIVTQVGYHRISIAGTVKPNATEAEWSGFWLQNVLVLSTNRRQREQHSGTSIEKSHRKIKSDQGLAGWLSWVYRNICKLAAEDIRNGLNSDAFIHNHGEVFRAAYNLDMLAAGWDDLKDMLCVKMAWKEGQGNNGFLCTVFRKGTKVGAIGVRCKGDHWQYGGKFDMGEVNPLFHGIEFKFAHKINVASCPDSEHAIKKAETLYVQKMVQWLRDHSMNAGLRGF